MNKKDKKKQKQENPMDNLLTQLREQNATNKALQEQVTTLLKEVAQLRKEKDRAAAGLTLTTASSGAAGKAKETPGKDTGDTPPPTSEKAKTDKAKPAPADEGGWVTKPIKPKPTPKPTESALGSMDAPKAPGSAAPPPAPTAGSDDEEETVDPDHWSHPELMYGGPKRHTITLGEEGFVRFRKEKVASKFGHDYAKSEAPLAALTPKPLTKLSVLCPVKIRGKSGKRLEWHYLTQVGLSPVPVTFSPPDAIPEVIDDFDDTEVVILTMTQAWLTKAEWNMFNQAEELIKIVKLRLQRHHLIDVLATREQDTPYHRVVDQSIFHPKVFGDPKDNNLCASASLRIQKVHRERLFKCYSGGVVPRPLTEPLPEVVWMPPATPSPEAYTRLGDLEKRTKDARGIAVGPRGAGIRVPPDQFSNKAIELLGAEPGAAFLRQTFGVRYDVEGLPWDLSYLAATRLLQRHGGQKRIVPTTETPGPGEAHPWDAECPQNGARRGRNGRVWRVFADPGSPVPEDFKFRGRLVMISPAKPPKPRARTVKEPQKRKPRDTQGGEAPTKPTKYAPGWQPDKPVPPSWAAVVDGRTGEDASTATEAGPSISGPGSSSATPSPDRAGGTGSAAPQPKALSRPPASWSAPPPAEVTPENIGEVLGQIAQVAALIPSLQALIGSLSGAQLMGSQPPPPLPGPPGGGADATGGGGTPPHALHSGHVHDLGNGGRSRSSGRGGAGSAHIDVKTTSRSVTDSTATAQRLGKEAADRRKQEKERLNAARRGLGNLPDEEEDSNLDALSDEEGNPLPNQ